MNMTKEAKQPKTFIELQNDIIEAMRTIFDPEIPVDIYELGLIYEIKVDPGNNAHIVMTLTSPMCPVAESLPVEVKEKAMALEGINDVEVELTFDPTWDQNMMSEAAQLELGLL